MRRLLDPGGEVGGVLVEEDVGAALLGEAGEAVDAAVFCLGASGLPLERGARFYSALGSALGAGAPGSLDGRRRQRLLGGRP